MDTLTAAHNSHLRAYMEAMGMSQAELGAVVDKSQTWVSERLRGITRWTLDDLDLLMSAGVPVYLPLYGVLPLGD